jgi:hypothetical protein
MAIWGVMVVQDFLEGDQALAQSRSSEEADAR